MHWHEVPAPQILEKLEEISNKTGVKFISLVAEEQVYLHNQFPPECLFCFIVYCQESLSRVMQVGNKHILKNLYGLIHVMQRELQLTNKLEFALYSQKQMEEFQQLDPDDQSRYYPLTGHEVSLEEYPDQLKPQDTDIELD